MVRSIEHALASERIDAVYVTTDDDEIADVSARAGAAVITRPEMLSGDDASTESAVAHALDELCAPPEIVVLLQCTSPFRSAGQLDAAIDQLERAGLDSLLSVAQFHGFVWKSLGEIALPATYEPGQRPRRQDIDDTFLETGSFYIFRRQLFEATGCRLGGRIGYFEVPPGDAIDVDEMTDLEQARQLVRRRDDDLPAAGEISWVVLDVDGTMTDGAMFYGEDGAELKRFDTRDGQGIANFRAAGGRVAIITGENSQAAKKRAEKLAVDHVALGCRHKDIAIVALMDRYGLQRDDVAVMGDDLNDLPMRPYASIFAAPASAQSEILAVADLVTSRPAGRGAVREFLDSLLTQGALRGRFPAAA